MRACLVLSTAALLACSPAVRAFPLQAPLWRDADLESVRAPCHQENARLVCSPQPYVSPHFWDEADSILFRPLSETLGVVTSGESVDVNSLDEVPDSSWFTNRVGARPMSLDEVRRGACTPSLLLDADDAADGSWVVDKGKAGGNTPGFRVSIPGKGRFLFKVDDADAPEQSSAADVISAAIYHAVGFDTPCEQVVYFRPSVLKLTPGLRYKWTSFGDEHDFDRAALDSVLHQTPHRGAEVRMLASAWMPGRLIGPFRYEGTAPTIRTTSCRTKTDESFARAASSRHGWGTSTATSSTRRIAGWPIARATTPHPGTSSTRSSTGGTAWETSGRRRRSRGAWATRTSSTGETWHPTS